MNRFWTLAAATLVLALAATGSGWAAPAGDEIVEHRVWLPVVQQMGCPYRPTYMHYESYDFRQPAGHFFYLGIGTTAIPEPELAGRAIIATDENMEDVIYRLEMRWYFHSLFAQLEQVDLDIGQTYYWQGRVVCENGAFGPWSTVQEFVATCETCD